MVATTVWRGDGDEGLSRTLQARGGWVRRDSPPASSLWGLPTNARGQREQALHEATSSIALTHNHASRCPSLSRTARTPSWLAQRPPRPPSNACSWQAHSRPYPTMTTHSYCPSRGPCHCCVAGACRASRRAPRRVRHRGSRALSAKPCCFAGPRSSPSLMAHRGSC